MKSAITNTELPQQPVPKDDFLQGESLSAGQALHRAISHHQAGQLQEAERLYRAILQSQPNHPDANHNLGVLAVQVRQILAALPHFKSALEADPNQGQYWLSYVDALIQADQTDTARQVLERGRRRGLQGDAFEALAGRLKAGDGAAEQSNIDHHIFKNSLPVSQEIPRGSSKKRNAKSAKPDKLAGKPIQNRGKSPNPKEVYILGTMFNERRYTEAASLAQAMTMRFPKDGFGWKVLGAVFKQLGRSSDALTPMQNAARLLPKDAESHNNLGTVLKDLGRLEEAALSYRQALQINPDYAGAHSNLGNALKELGRLEEAEASCRLALQIKPDLAEAHNNLGNILKDLGRLMEAEGSCRRALQIKPDLAEAHYNLGTILKDLIRLDEAENSYRKAIEIKPDFVEARLALVMNTLPIVPQSVNSSVSALEAFDHALETLTEWLISEPSCQERFSKSIGAHQPFFLAYRPGYHVARLSRYGDLVGSAQAQPLVAPHVKRERIRLVVVSRHLHRHSVWDVLIRGLLVHLDRKRFEVVLYFVGKNEDEETVFAKNLADVWRAFHTVAGLQAWLAAMARDQPDVIFYPEIGMDPVTLGLAARRLAPLQVASWGHPITTGLPFIDLYFSGELLEPEGADDHYRERLVRLPGTGCCTTPIELIAEDLGQQAKCLDECRGPVFLVAQAPFKLDPADDAIFANIAAASAESTVLLVRHGKYPWATDQVISRLRHAFREQGLDPDKQLRVMPWLSLPQFHALLDRCDVYLDCPAFSGYTTAWQAIHRGLPVVTLEGEFMRQRLAAGLLRKIGMPDTIASSSDEYLAIALQLAEECQDPVVRATRRQALKSAAPQADHDVSVVRAFEQCLIDALAERE
ncbi:MAG: tetratricopeptide repeat protein [Proteobacteria bacterium]|nr:tetratricopeptide repeat protein [Pseudomonadota bacterium]